MSTREKRLAPRFELELPVTIKTREQELTSHTMTLSRHGVFVATPHLRMAGELIQLYITLPFELVTAAASLKMMAVVARVVTTAEAEQRHQKAGMGLKFFMVATADKEIWDAFIAGLDRARKLAMARPQEAGAPSATEREAAPVCPIPLPPHRQGPMRFLVRARNPEQLRQFAIRELAQGSMFLRTPLMRSLREEVEIILIHPRTEEEFPIAGLVSGLRSTGPIAERGMAIEFSRCDAPFRSQFDRFVSVGAHTTADLMAM